MTRRTKNTYHFQFNTIIILICFIIVFFYIFNTNKPSIIEGYEYVEVVENYGKEIDLYCSLEQLPPSYFKSLAILECSGKKDFPHRFERHVYKKLKEVKRGERKEYENITQNMLKNITNEGLKNLATSWGPFQIMGYKCLEMHIKIEDLRGNDAVFWGVKWVNNTYGNYLRQGKFKDAFHIHNTGKRYPLDNKPFTHDPNYVENGIKYMAHF